MNNPRYLKKINEILDEANKPKPKLKQYQIFEISKTDNKKKNKNKENNKKQIKNKKQSNK
tara:strand:- start:818 stop:997 length:180 start_codon:yes stop_codon:yes gene_type:complete